MHIVSELIGQNGFYQVPKRFFTIFDLETALYLTQLIDYESYLIRKKVLPEDGFFYIEQKVINKVFNGSMSPHKQNRVLDLLEEIWVVATKRKLVNLGNRPAMNAKFYRLNKNVIEFLLTSDQLKTLNLEHQKLSSLNLKSFKVLIRDKSIPLYNIKKKNINITPDLKNGENLSSKQKSLNKKYKDLSIFLAKIIQSKNKINKTTQVSSWKKPIQDLIEKDLEVDSVPILKRIKRVQDALDWYKENIGDKYVPVIQSGNTLRSKFEKLENAIDRSKTKHESNFGENNQDSIYDNLDEEVID